MDFLKDKRVLAAIAGLIVLVLGYFGYDAVVTPKEQPPTSAPAETSEPLNP